MRGKKRRHKYNPKLGTFPSEGEHSHAIKALTISTIMANVFNKVQFTDNTRQSRFMSLVCQLVMQIGCFHGLLQVTNVGGEIQRQSRPTGSRTALKPADDKARLMMSFKVKCVVVDDRS